MKRALQLRHVRPRASAGLPLDGFSVNLRSGNFKEILSRHTQFGYKQTAISATINEDLSTITLLREVREILWLDDVAKGTHCCVYGFITPTALICQQYKANALWLLHGSNVAL